MRTRAAVTTLALTSGLLATMATPVAAADGDMSPQLGVVQGSLNKPCIGLPAKGNVGNLVGIVNVAVQDIPVLASSQNQVCTDDDSLSDILGKCCVGRQLKPRPRRRPRLPPQPRAEGPHRGQRPHYAEIVAEKAVEQRTIETTTRTASRVGTTGEAGVTSPWTPSANSPPLRTAERWPPPVPLG